MTKTDLVRSVVALDVFEWMPGMELVSEEIVEYSDPQGVFALCTTGNVYRASEIDAECELNLDAPGTWGGLMALLIRKVGTPNIQVHSDGGAQVRWGRGGIGAGDSLGEALANALLAASGEIP